MAFGTIFTRAASALAALAAGPALAAEEGPVLWRALGANAHESTFATGLSAKKATEAEAVASMRSACENRGENCAVVAVFSAGCRFVALGGKPTAPKVLHPVYVVGASAEDAQQRCRRLDLVCNREPQGGCLD